MAKGSMEKLSKVLFVTGGLLAVLIGAVVYCTRSSTSVDTIEDHEANRSRVSSRPLRTSGGRMKAKKEWRMNNSKIKARHDSREKPSFELDEEDEARLDAEQRALIAAIRQALDREDLPSLIKHVSRMQQSDLWPDGFPVAIRKAAIEALGWFGHDAIPEIVGFLGDPNEDVLQTAIEAYEMSLMDANGDEELSRLLIAACQAINDSDAIDSFMMELNNIRPSRVVSTLEEISKTGSAAAKAALAETISFYTGEDECTTVEKLKEWYNDPSGENRDDEDAEDFYGPQKDE